jgi:hypothetical protein
MVCVRTDWGTCTQDATLHQSKSTQFIFPVPLRPAKPYRGLALFFCSQMTYRVGLRWETAAKRSTSGLQTRQFPSMRPLSV